LTEDISTAKLLAIGDAKKQIGAYADAVLLHTYGDSKKGCARIKDLQICWGRVDTQFRNTNFRDFQFEFAKPFVEDPIVAEGITGSNPTNEGFAFADANGRMNQNGGHGSLFAIRPNTEDTAEGILSYVAVGKWMQTSNDGATPKE